MARIECNIRKEIYRNEMNGYAVILVKLKSSDDEELKNEKFIYIVGILGDLNDRVTYVMNGSITRHPKYGLQFKVDNYDIVTPTETEEIIDFLSSNMFPIGEKTAERIVDKFGSDALNVILNEPLKLTSIPRINEEKATTLNRILNNYQGSSDVIISLGKMGFTTKEAMNILNKYGKDTLNVINNDIYKLTDEMTFNFVDIDNIAINNGVAKDDERRIKALIIYLMNDITFKSGDTYLFLDEIVTSLSKYVDTLSAEEIEYYLIRLNEMGKIKIDNRKYYLQEQYEAEQFITKRICYLNDLKPSKFPKLKEKIEELEKQNNIVYDDIQKEAIIKAMNNNITIITGGPGTGKTTIIKAITSLLKYVYKAKDEDIALLAPTGRAAKKMMETTLIPAFTIHKYLAWDKEKNVFLVDEDNPNSEKYIIVDEVSMIDNILMSALLKGIRRDVKLILVGDYYQLPSVSQGQVLKDLIDSDMLDVIYLKLLYRQNECSYIPVLAQEIKEKELGDFLGVKDDYNFLECADEQVINVIETIIDKAIEKGYNEEDIQVLAPMYKSLNGIDALNRELQKKFNPPSPDKNELVINGVLYRVGDKILQLANDSEINVCNGDQGYIMDIYGDNKAKTMIIDFDGNKVTINKEKMLNIRHAYAISVHKAQGNEFRMVIMPIVASFVRMLNNKLVYTAVTRAKKVLMLVGNSKYFEKAVYNDYVEKRKTSLKDMIISRYSEM